MGSKRKISGIKSIAVSALVVFAAGAIIAAAGICLLAHRPMSYQPASAGPDEQVNSYLANYLVPTFYNGIQLDDAFELVFPQDKLNQLLADSEAMGIDWPVDFDGVKISAPAVVFAPSGLLLMATVTLYDMPVVVTLYAEPAFDKQGLLSFNIRSVKAGAVNVTLLARIIAGRIFTQHTSSADSTDPDAVFIATLSEALLNNKPIEPVFTCDDRTICLTKLNISAGRLTIELKAR